MGDAAVVKNDYKCGSGAVFCSGCGCNNYDTGDNFCGCARREIEPRSNRDRTKARTVGFGAAFWPLSAGGRSPGSRQAPTSTTRTPTCSPR
eukprot:4172914-Prymnesium_polylepis.1